MTGQQPKVLLLTLTQKTSAKGNVYLSGWLGKARVVGFRGEDDDQGHPVWNVYVSEPEPRPEGAQARPPRHEDVSVSAALSQASVSPGKANQRIAARASKAALDGQRRQEEAMTNLNDVIPD